MTAIVKQDNVYVVVKTEEEISDEKKVLLEKDDSVIAAYISKNSAVTDRLLYGGRVNIKVDYYTSWGGYYVEKIELYIDGVRFDSSDSYSWSFEQVAAYLNQFEHLGLDTFLDNYKAQVKAHKSELEGLLEKWEQQQAIHFDEKMVENLNKLRDSIKDLSYSAFYLFISMNAGLENQDYIDAYENAVSHLSQYL